MQLKLRFPDANLDEFDTIAFQDSLAESLGLEYDKIYLKSIEEGSVIATVVLLPQWIFEVPPNATSSGANSTETSMNEKESAPSDPGISSGAFRASMSSGGANESMTDDGAFRRKEEEFDPTTRDYSRPTLLKLEKLLSSHYLPGIGQFNYVTTTAEKYCEFGQLSKEAIREKIANCSGSDGSCGVVWGEEMPLSSTEMPMPNGAEKIYESIYRSRDESVPLQTNSFALNFAGNPVEIPELDILVTGNYANFSAKNCTDCECQGKVESQQPFIEWSVMNNY